MKGDNDETHCHRHDDQETEGQQQGKQLKGGTVSPYSAYPLLTSSTSRRKRRDFGPQATQQLKSFFQTNPYPGYQEREKIARMLKLDEDRIQVWFQNRRSRQKKYGSRAKYLGERKTKCSSTSSNIQRYQGVTLVSPASKTQSLYTNDRQRKETAANRTPGNITAAHMTPDFTSVHTTPGNITSVHTTPGNMTAAHMTLGNFTAVHTTPGNLTAVNMTPGNLTAVFAPQEKSAAALVVQNIVVSNLEAAAVPLGHPVNVVPCAVPSNSNFLRSCQSTPLRSSGLEIAAINIHNAVFLSSPGISLFPAPVSGPGQGSTVFTPQSTSLSSASASSQGYMPDVLTLSTGSLSSVLPAGTRSTPVFFASPPCTKVSSAPHSHPPHTPF